MLLHLLTALLELVTLVVSAVISAYAAVCSLIGLSRAKRQRERLTHANTIKALEIQLETWKTYSIDYSKAMTAAMLAETVGNARPLTLPPHWDVTGVAVPNFGKFDEPSRQRLLQERGYDAATDHYYRRLGELKPWLDELANMPSGSRWFVGPHAPIDARKGDLWIAVGKDDKGTSPKGIDTLYRR